MTTFKTKLGTAKGVERSRIWIEGKRLIDAGFTAKDTYFFKEYARLPRRVLILRKVSDDDILSDMPCKVSGKGSKPIIDITGKKVAQFFGAHCDHVEVEFSPGVIWIKEPHYNG